MLHLSFKSSAHFTVGSLMANKLARPALVNENKSSNNKRHISDQNKKERRPQIVLRTKHGNQANLKPKVTLGDGKNQIMTHVLRQGGVTAEFTVVLFVLGDGHSQAELIRAHSHSLTDGQIWLLLNIKPKHADEFLRKGKKDEPC